MVLLQVGFGGVVATARILIITTIESTPIRREVRQADEDGRLIDLTYGRRRRSVIFLDTGHVVISARRVERLVEQWESTSEEGMTHAMAEASR